MLSRSTSARRGSGGYHANMLNLAAPLLRVHSVAKPAGTKRRCGRFPDFIKGSRKTKHTHTHTRVKRWHNARRASLTSHCVHRAVIGLISSLQAGEMNGQQEHLTPGGGRAGKSYTEKTSVSGGFGRCPTGRGAGRGEKKKTKQWSGEQSEVLRARVGPSAYRKYLCLMSKY